MDMINPHSKEFWMALSKVLELAEENALQDDDVEADASLLDEQVKQMKACQLVRDFLDDTVLNAI